MRTLFVLCTTVAALQVFDVSFTEVSANVMPNPLEEGKGVEGVKVGDGEEGSNLKVIHTDSVVINENGENGSMHNRNTKTRVEKSKTCHNKMSNNKDKRNGEDADSGEIKYTIMPGKPRPGGYVRRKGYIW